MSEKVVRKRFIIEDDEDDEDAVHTTTTITTTTTTNVAKPDVPVKQSPISPNTATLPAPSPKPLSVSTPVSTSSNSKSNLSGPSPKIESFKSSSSGLFLKDDIKVSSSSPVIKKVSTAVEKKSDSGKSPVEGGKKITPTRKKFTIDDDEDDDDDKPIGTLVKKVKKEESSSKYLMDDDDDEDLPLSVLREKKVSKPVKKEVKVKKETPAVKVKKEPTAVKVKKETPAVKVKKEPVVVKVKKEPSSGTPKADSTPVKVKKEPNPDEPQVKKENGEEEDEYRWWEEQENLLENGNNNGEKWESLQHNGVYFPPDYEPHGVKLIYDGVQLDLEPEAEEVAGFYAAMIETDYAKSDVFNKNFFTDFRQVLKSINSKHKDTIKSFSKCDFSLMAKHFDKLKEERKGMTKDQKEEIKKKKKEVDDHYGFCLLNGYKQKVGNFRVEPPGLFRGRGKHPKAGCLKKRIRPEDVTINIGKDAKIPVPPANHKWAEVVHNNQVTWLATWMDTINNSPKYVFLAANSSLKGMSDLKKFEKARNLSRLVDHLRQVNEQELKSDKPEICQRATALWLIDKLALRAGNEKGSDEADTVGCCSLRVEHVSFDSTDFSIIFDFLGKDSIRYYNQVKVPKIIFENMKKFTKSKKPGDDLFDRLSTTSLNTYLNGLMDGLTAKVFRTYNASYTFEVELAKSLRPGTVAEKVLSYNRANRQVAILCNHQRSVPKSHGESMNRLKEKILMVKYDRYLLRQDILSQLTSTKERRQAAYAEYKLEEDESDLDEEVRSRKKLEKIEIAKVKAQKKREKEAAAAASGSKQPVAPSSEPDDDDLIASSGKKNSTTPVEKLIPRLAKLDQRLKAMKLSLIDRDEGKSTALGTSKINYIDPRISVAWCKSQDVPLDKIFNRTLRDKFKWAMAVDASWRFDKRGTNADEDSDDNNEDDSEDDEQEEEEAAFTKSKGKAAKKPAKSSAVKKRKRNSIDEDDDEDDD